jgi:hypothetical protein
MTAIIEMLDRVKALEEGLEGLLNDTQHLAHTDCVDGYCPVRDARALLENKHE